MKIKITNKEGMEDAILLTAFIMGLQTLVFSIWYLSFHYIPDLYALLFFYGLIISLFFYAVIGEKILVFEVARNAPPENSEGKKN